jgi:segregation and condensation protein B
MDENFIKEKIGALEALLFYYGEPLSYNDIARLIEVEENYVKEIVEKLKNKLESDEERGLEIIEHNSKVELVTKQKYSHILKKIIEEEFSENITPAALETLSIIAYLGPVTRAQIDYLRGVNSTFILRNLLIRGLILRNLQSGKKNTYEYVVSPDFLKHLGIDKIEKLPEYEKYREILKKFEIERENEEKEIKEEQNILEEQNNNLILENN